MTTATQARRGDHWTALVGIDTRLRTLLPTALLVIFLVAVPVHAWWARSLLGVGGAVVALLGVVSWAGFTIPQWAARRVHIRRGRRHALTEPSDEATDENPPAAPVAPSSDAPAPPGADGATDTGSDDGSQRARIVLPVTAVSSGDEVGVDWRGGQLVAALDLHGHPHVPHELHQRRVTSDAILPIAELEGRLAGLTGGEAPDTVDLVFEARRLTPTRYSTVYDTQLSGQPAVGFRRTLLIARFDPAANPAYYAARTSLPDAVAATMARIRRTVAAADCPATALAGPALKALRHSTMPAAPTLRDPSAAAPATASALERWTYVAPDSSAGMFDAVYAIDPAAFTDTRLRDLWSIRADSVTVTLRWSVRGWLGFVRVRTASAPTAPPLPFVRPLPGQQAAALAIGRPVADATPVHTVFDPAPTLVGVSLPAGSDGQVLGADDVGRQVLLPLVPGIERVVNARVSLVYAQQLVMRAEATGANVTIVTDTPARWAPLSSARIAVVATDAELPRGDNELHVYDDRLEPPAHAAAATLSLTAPDGPAPAREMAGQKAITIDQSGDQLTVVAGAKTYHLHTRIDPAEVTYLPAAQALSRGHR